MDKIIIDAWKDSIEEIKEKLTNNYVYVKAVHYSTSIDNEAYIKSKGFLGIKELLSDKESPISKFLLEFNIMIDINNAMLYYMGNGQKICKETSGHNFLWHKIYNEKGAREVFIFTPNPLQKFNCYPNIMYHPDILQAISNFVYDHFLTKKNLGQEWTNRNSKLHIYGLNIKIDMLVNNSFQSVNRDVFIDLIRTSKNTNDYLIFKLREDCAIPYNEIEEYYE